MALPRAHVVTFHSQGRPHDGGMPLGRVAGIMRAAYEPHVASFTAYTPTFLANLSAAGVSGRDALRPSERLAHNLGLAEIGGGAFKPFAILHRLQQLPAGDLLIFRDVNCLKHPPLLAGAAQIGVTANWLLSAAGTSDDVWMPYENNQLRVKHHCKAHAVREVGREAGLSGARLEATFEHPLSQANTLVVRATPAAAAFVLAWLRSCLVPGRLAMRPNPRPHAEFRWYTPEQCIFSLLGAQRPLFRRHLAVCYGLEGPSSVRLLPPATFADSALASAPALPDSFAHWVRLACRRFLSHVPVLMRATRTRADGTT